MNGEQGYSYPHMWMYSIFAIILLCCAIIYVTEFFNKETMILKDSNNTVLGLNPCRNKMLTVKNKRIALRNSYTSCQVG